MTYFWNNPILQPNRRWTRAYINWLPDSAFLYVDKARVERKDREGRSHPLDARHLPVRDAQGRVDCAHVRNAIARAPQVYISAREQKRAQGKARRLLERHCPL